MTPESSLEIIEIHQKALPVNLDGIAQDLGVRVRRLPLGPNVSGEIRRDGEQGGPSGFLILVDSEEAAVRQRFTLAHELAHFILHRDLIEHRVVDNAMYRSTELPDRYESQANSLAVDILMPFQRVKTEHARDAEVRELARRFGVSQEAMRIRLQWMGLLPPASG